jgi:hypothetical protein
MALPNSQAMLNFKGTRTQEICILHFLRHFLYIIILTEVSTMKILCITLYFTLTNTTSLHYTVFHTSVTHQITLDHLTEVIQLDIWIITLVVCGSCGSHFIRCAVSEIRRQELQRVYNNLFIRGQLCLRIEGGHIQHLLYNAVSYITHITSGNVRLKLAVCLGLVLP